MATEAQDSQIQSLTDIINGPFSLDYIQEHGGFESDKMNKVKLPDGPCYLVRREYSCNSYKRTFATRFLERQFIDFDISSISCDYNEKNNDVYRKYLFRDFITDDNKRIYMLLISRIAELHIPLRLIIDVIEYVKVNLIEDVLVPEVIIQLWKNYHKYFQKNPTETYMFNYSYRDAERQFGIMERNLEYWRSSFKF